MFTRRFVTIAAFSAVCFTGLASLSSAASALEVQKFTKAAFETAQSAGKPILIEIHADWCPTCKAQSPIIGELTAQPKFKDMAILAVDFDNQKDIVKAFGARTQSTLIVFKGKSETGRSVGDTNTASIAKLLDSAI